jgi:hypothetical protein
MAVLYSQNIACQVFLYYLHGYILHPKQPGSVTNHPYFQAPSTVFLSNILLNFGLRFDKNYCSGSLSTSILYEKGDKVKQKIQMVSNNLNLINWFGCGMKAKRDLEKNVTGLLF